MEAYTYLLIHIQSGKFYYGCRKSKTYDLFQNYFTSSKLIKRMIQEDGIQAFSHEIRKTFDSYAEARSWECKVLQRIKAPSNPNCLNQAISAPRICSKDPEAEKRRRIGISNAMKARWKNPEYQAFWKTSERKAKAKIAGALSWSNPHKPRIRKPKKKKTWSKVKIERNGIIKEIFGNQVPAYVKCGWNKIGGTAWNQTKARQ